jgi:NADPH:quinone reductase-like Zn-dependent oxidoreductase
VVKIITKPCEECEYSEIKEKQWSDIFPWMEEGKIATVLICSKAECPFEEDIEEREDDKE